MLIAAAAPIVWMILAGLGRTGADARDIAGVEPVRRPARDVIPQVVVPDVRLDQLPPAQASGEPSLARNPFALAPRSVPTPVAMPVAVSTPETPPFIPASVPLSLIGVAATTRADGRVERTAIVVAGPADPLYMVREADTVTTRYRVDAVTADSVLLVDRETGASLRLTLR